MTVRQPHPAATAFAARRHGLLIDGRTQPALGGETLEVFDPARGRLIAVVPRGRRLDIDLAVQAARTSFEDERWRGLPADGRGRVLWRFAELVDAHAEELADLDILNNGMTEELAGWIVAAGASWLRAYAGLTTRILGKNASAAISGGGLDIHAYTAAEPIGVAGLILPWNAPIGSFLNKVGPALAAGCSCVVKPAENTPLTALRLGELALEAGVPPGVVNVVPGFGDAGQALVDHPDVDKISFTGSTAVGKHIVRSASDNLKRVTLELGGKSACIVFDDADLDVAIPTAADAIFKNTGQNCLAGSRLFVQEGSIDAVVSGLADIARGIRIGSGFDPAAQMGPIISEKQLARVMDYVAAGQAEGAELVAGGRRREGDGYFAEPTIFRNAGANSRIYREEVFGPVLVVTPFSDTGEVIKAANDSRYGLGGGVFTCDLNKAHRVAARLRTGNVWVNTYGLLHSAMPFGGIKESGWGSEMGQEGMEAFLQTKSVFVHLRA